MMKTFKHIVVFEWKNRWRSKNLKVLLLIVLFLGIYGIYFGKFEIDRQNERIAEVEDFERSEFDSLLLWASLDTSITENREKYEAALSPTGGGWKKHFTYFVSHESPPTAALCLGQRDLFPSYYGFNVSDLARQVNTSELINPMKLLIGNFDLSYVYVFLFPLLIVALFYDLYASEKEGGTLPLLQSQSTSIAMVLAARGFLMFFLVCVLGAALLLLGFFVQGISFENNLVIFGKWLTTIIAYFLFWTILMSAIVYLGKSSELSAMFGLGAWISLTVISPALLNLYVQSNYPQPNRAEKIHALRTMNDQNWNQPKSHVWDKFYAEHPEYNDGDTSNFNKWYYASFANIDSEAKSLEKEFEKQVEDRVRVLEKWEWLAPAAMVHQKLSRFSMTDRDSHLSFLSELQAYHANLKELYYARIFSGEQFTLEDLRKIEKKL